MTDGSGILELVVVTVPVLGVVTLMLVIVARSRGRGRRQIIRACAMVWSAVALTLGIAWLLERWTGGGVFDLQLGGEVRMLTRSLGRGAAVGVVALLLALAALYVATITVVRRLLADNPASGLRITPDAKDEAP